VVSAATSSALVPMTAADHHKNTRASIGVQLPVVLGVDASTVRPGRQ
jgi:hypothetical protein